MLSLVYTSSLDRYFLSMPEKEGEDRKQWKNIQGPDGTFSYHNMNRIQSVFGHPIPSVTFGPVA